MNTPQVTVATTKAASRPGVIVEIWATCRRVGSHFLFRVPRHLKARARKNLPDGSRLVRLNVREQERPWRIGGNLEIQEIRVQVGRRGFRQ
jgi:hypothetical protein